MVIEPQEEREENIVMKKKIWNTRSCVKYLLIGCMFIWIVISSIFAMFLTWFIEQAVFDGSFLMNDFRWIIELVFSAVIIVPIGLLMIVFKNQPEKPILKMLLLAGFLALFHTPIRLISITDSQLTSILQILEFTIFASVVYFFFIKEEKMKKPAVKCSVRGVSISMAVLAVITVPWVLWGALGSTIDSLLSIIVGILFSIIVCLLLRIGLGGLTQSIENLPEDGKNPSLFIRGIIVWITLLLLTAILTQNGNQGLMFISIPFMGFIYMAIEEIQCHVGNKNWISAILLIGFSVALPLLWIDADELMLVTSSGKGELLEVAFRIVLYSLCIQLLLFLCITFLKTYMRSRVVMKNKMWVIALVLWIVVSIIYVRFGTPGFYGEHLFVVMKTQAELTDVSKIDDVDVRRASVYQKLVKVADIEQSSIRSDLERFRIQYKPYYLVNGLEVKGGPLVKFWLSNRSDVDRILDNPQLRPLRDKTPLTKGSADFSIDKTPWNLMNIHADRVWKELGITGKGIVIGQTDSGVDGSHPELADSYRGIIDDDDDYNWYDPWFNTNQPTDNGFHGTHTLGSILGNHVGVAPDASWIGCVNLARNLGNTADYLECMQFVLAPYPQKGNAFIDGKPSLGANIINNSWGCPAEEGCDPYTFLPAVRALRIAGVFMVVSAGNSGMVGCGSVDAPMAIYDEVYSVGSINKENQLSSFSSLGPVTVDGSQRIKPNIVAPGEDILSSYPGNSYEISSGTSMAGPHVAGVVALMWSAAPGLVGNIEKTEEIINISARPYEGYIHECIINHQVPNNASGYGIVDAYQAVKLAIDYQDNVSK